MPPDVVRLTDQALYPGPLRQGVAARTACREQEAAGGLKTGALATDSPAATGPVR